MSSLIARRNGGKLPDLSLSAVRRPMLAPGRPAAFVMLVLFLGAIGVGYMLLPGANERIAMLERDGQDREALGLLEQRFQAGDRSQRTLFQLQRIHEHLGNLGRARQLLEMLAELRPKDTQIQSQLARFYRQTQDMPAYLLALERQLAARYSEPACKELIGHYRSRGDFDKEHRWLGQCRAKGYRRPDDIIRLAYLEAAEGRLAETANLLRSVDDRRRLRVDIDRRMFFTALVEAGDVVEAQRRALRWLKGNRDQSFAMELIESLVEEKRHDLAIEMARAAGTRGDGVSLTVAELMLDRGEELAARTYLRGLIGSLKIGDVDTVHRFIGAALDAEEPDLAFAAASRFGLDKLTQKDLVDLAEALSAVDKADAFKAVRELIEPQTLRDNPLLAAAVAVERGATEPARQLLSQVPVDGLDEWRLALWSRLMETTGRRGAATQTLRRLGVEPAAPSTKPGRIIRRFKDSKDARTQRRQKRRPPAAVVPPGANSKPGAPTKGSLQAPPQSKGGGG